jgi:hypothetical protein
MNSEPLSIPRYIALVSREAADRTLVKAWFSCVRQHAPTGLLLAIPTTDDKGMPQTVCLVHRETKTKHCYMVPLTRDLEDDEAARIVNAFSALAPEGEFDVETSASHLSGPEKPEASVNFNEDKYLDLCMAWAKRQHEKWLKDRTEQGWRYGTELSMSAKTNPLLRPFEQLPDQYRVPNFEEPQALLDLLNDQGYAVITKQELESMLTLMRQSATVPAKIAESQEDDEDEIDEAAIPADRMKMATWSREDRRAEAEWNSAAPGLSKNETGAQGRPTASQAPSGSVRPAFGKRRAG